MGRHEDEEFVPIPVDEFVGMAPKSVVVMIGGDNYFVGKSQVDNLEDIEAHLGDPDNSELMVPEIEVPLWLARKNGWIDDED